MQQSVVQILADRYGIDTRPGGRIHCPFCKHHTMTVKPNDEIAKCFHVACGRHISGWKDPNYQRSLYAALETVFHDFHRHLLSQEGQPGDTAWNYLINVRWIHRQVLCDSMLGAVPSDYDVSPAFEPVIEAARKAGKSKKEDNGTRIANMVGHLDFLTRVRDDLQKKVNPKDDRGKAKPGWLSFHYQDSRYRYTAIRLRNCYEKEKDFAFVSYKPLPYFGIFGHSLFSTHSHLEKEQETLIVVEGEINTLQLQSLCLRVGAAERKELTYIYSAAVGGVTNADYLTIGQSCKLPLLIYDNDEAGQTLVQKASDRIHCETLTTPGAKDLDEWIRKYPDPLTCWTDLQKLIQTRVSQFRKVEATSIEVGATRDSSLKEFRKHEKVANIILEDLQIRGQLYHNQVKQEPYYFLKQEKQLLPIHEDNQPYRLLLSRYGLNPTEQVFKYVVEHSRISAFRHGLPTEVKRLSYYDAPNCTVYVNNYANRIWRIDPQGIQMVDNGTNGVLFLHDPNSEPFLTDPEDFKRRLAEYRAGHRSLLWEILLKSIHFTQDVLLPGERGLLLYLWTLANYFRELMKSRPVVLFVGAKGSGKSLAAQRIGCIFHGSRFALTSLPERQNDFDTILINKPYIALDQVDTRSAWLEERIATAATGGSIEGRLYYTNADLLSLPLDTFMTITSRTPRFRRDDVADRLIILKVDRVSEGTNGDQFEQYEKLLRQVIDNRDQIMVEILSALQEITVALAAAKGKEYRTNFRMADFGAWTLAISDYFGFRPVVEGIYNKLISEQSLYALEDTAIFEPMKEWVAGNPGRPVTLTELCSELERTAERGGYEFSYAGKNRAFTAKFLQLESNLSEIFRMTRTPKGNGRVFWSFYVKTDQTSNQSQNDKENDHDDNLVPF